MSSAKSKDATPTTLNFEVSTGLKRVLGRELIIDEEVAIFELVKNSFDAGAKQVNLHFTDSAIWVVDDGCGMSLDDLHKKWLFVAYSAKRDDKGYRDEIAEKRKYAGSKGIGRFSSDRLGTEVNLQTRPENSPDKGVHRVFIDWERFEADDLKRFETIPVDYSLSNKFELPDELPRLQHGTAIEIRNPRLHWDRTSILQLKRSLSKLINPFGAEVDGFKIFVSAPVELEADEKDKRTAGSDQLAPNRLVNGEVGNFIFTTLRSKTTFITMEIIEATNTIVSKLMDRGELVYHIRENNPYPHLTSSGFRCELYYLNRSAKTTFTRRVGIQSTQFGSVFLFRNGFRVFPIGEDEDDWFGLNRRKQQGYARFLGTREIIGRIDVSGDEEAFKEASSRNQGLIDSPATQEIWKCFREHCLKRLEKYVVPVSWKDKAETDTSDLSRLLTDRGRERVSASVAALVDSSDIELLEYSKKLVTLLNERSEQFESSLTSLRRIAEKANDRTLLKSIESAEARFEELKKSEAEARKIAEQERAAKYAAQKRAEKAEATTATATEALEEEKKINLFLKSVGTLDTDTIINMHHQITIYAVDLEMQLENFIAGIGKRKNVPKDEILASLEQISFLNKKIKTVSKFATKANFILDSEKIETDLTQYIVDYISQVARDFSPSGLNITVDNTHPGLMRSFKPIEISIVVDNFISNAKKARATSLNFRIYQPDNRKNILLIDIKDNGRGLERKANSDRLFEKGYTTTDGAGLGLYHVTQALGEMGGSVRIGPEQKRGMSFIVEVTKK